MRVTRRDYPTGSIIHIDDDQEDDLFRLVLYTGGIEQISFYGNTFEDISSAKRFAQALQKAIEIWEAESDNTDNQV